jgi:DNA-binding NtrC family response regulator
MNYGWPGNVRQLQNLVERLIVFSSENIISRQQVEFELEREIEKNDLFDLKNISGRPLKSALEELEKKMIIHAIRKSNGNEEAAQLLGIHRTTLIRKMQKYGIREKPNTF